MDNFIERAKTASTFALIFFVLNFPLTNKILQQLLPITLITSGNCPTYAGVLLQSIIFFWITLVAMAKDGFMARVKYSTYATLIYFFVANPVMYSMSGAVFGPKVATLNGCPTILGVLLHSFVFFIIFVLTRPNVLSKKN